MSKYKRAEVEDWREFLEGRRIIDEDIIKAAEEWDTCPVGHMHRKYPSVVRMISVQLDMPPKGKRSFPSPEDLVLKELGELFFSDVEYNDKKGALQILERIEERVGVLVKLKGGAVRRRRRKGETKNDELREEKGS